MSGYRSDPSALRFLIGHDLRATRERAGIKQVAAAKILGCSPARINYLESGKTQQQPHDVTALLSAYGAEPEHVTRMASLASRADRDTWWAPWGRALPEWFKIFVGLEGLARSEFTYQPLVVPGQLQTPAYATALLVDNLRVPLTDVHQVVRARMARQRLAHEHNPLRFRAVIEEYVLDRTVGGPQVMREQLEQILALMQLDNVELRVMPVTVAAHDGLNGDFLQLDFEEAESIGYVEHPTGALYIQDPDQVVALGLAAGRLYENALSPSDSIDAITARIERLKGNPGGLR